MSDFLAAIIMGISGACLLAGIYVGNLGGDQSTLRDCATNGAATMLGGGTIKCEVLKKEQP